MRKIRFCFREARGASWVLQAGLELVGALAGRQPRRLLGRAYVPC